MSDVVSHARPRAGLPIAALLVAGGGAIGASARVGIVVWSHHKSINSWPNDDVITSSPAK